VCAWVCYEPAVLRSRTLLALGLALCLTAATSEAEAVVVERVVAVVGEKPILLSELRRRAKAALLQAQRSLPEGPQLAAAESTIMKEALGRMVDEELEAQAAERSRVAVTSEEVSNALRTVAGGQGLSVADVYKQARQQFGLTDQEYRDEIRRQLLEGKMLQIRVKGRIRITEEDVKNAYERYAREEKKRREYHPAWIVLSIAPGSSAEAIAERKATAEVLAERAKKEDFAALATKFSDDTPTRAQGGDLGIRAPAGSPSAQQGRPILAAELEQALLALEDGGVSGPVRYGDAYVVLKLLARQPSQLGPYEQAKNTVVQLLQNELFIKAKKKWLEELRKKTHVEERL
jgi:peptidyl-prolyl cis-trans isomerase SurA